MWSNMDNNILIYNIGNIYYRVYHDGLSNTITFVQCNVFCII